MTDSFDRNSDRLVGAALFDVIENKYGIAKIAELLKVIKSKAMDAPIREIFEQAGIDYDLVENAWRNYNP